MTTPGAYRSDIRAISVSVLLLAFVALGSLQWISARWLYSASFESAERTDALARARHVQEMVRSRADTLMRNAADSGAWDESYLYMSGRNPGHLTLIFVPESYWNLHVYAYAFVREDGHVKGARQFDVAQGQYVTAHDGFQKAFARDGVIGRHLDRSPKAEGFASIDGRLFAWGAGSILHSSGQGPPLGHLVMVTALDDAFVQTAANMVQSHVELVAHPVSGSGFNPPRVPLELSDVRFSERSESALESVFPVSPLDRDTVLMESLHYRAQTNLRSPNFRGVVLRKDEPTILFLCHQEIPR